MAKRIFTLSLFILIHCKSIWTSQRHNRGQYVDPNDLFSFDATNMRMKKQAQDQATQASSPVNGMPANTQAIDNNKKKERGNPIESGEMAKWTDADNSSQLRQSYETVNALLQQYTMTLVHLVEAKISSRNEPVNLDLRIKISFEDVAKLRSFGKGESSKFEDVHETLTNMLQFANTVHFHGAHLYWLEAKMGLSFSVLFMMLAIALTILAGLMMLTKLHFTWRLVWQAIAFAFLISVGFTWVELYQKEAASQEKILMEKMKDHCPKLEDLTFWDRLTAYVSSSFTFNHDSCKEYFQAMLVSPVVKATPMEAIAAAFVKTFCTPLEIIGSGLHKFLVAMLKDLPLQLQIIIFIFVALTGMWCVFVRSHYYLHIPFISIGPSPTPIQSTSLRTEETPALAHCHSCNKKQLENNTEGSFHSKVAETEHEVMQVQGRRTAAVSSLHLQPKEAIQTIQRDQLALAGEKLENAESDSLPREDACMVDEIGKLPLYSNEKHPAEKLGMSNTLANINLANTEHVQKKKDILLSGAGSGSENVDLDTGSTSVL